MSALDAEEKPQEIIIVRRASEDEEGGHHGGAWKIAFADFMTAMMCFFLVMWLINAANEQTKAAVASYFNPVKLIDRNTNRRGLDDIGKGPQQTTFMEDQPKRTSDTPNKTTDGMSGPEENKNSTDTAEQRKFSDENLFSDPYAVLAEIAADTGTKQNVSQMGDGGTQAAGPATGASGGQSYRDPFAPDFWTQQVAVPRDGVKGSPDAARDKAAGADIKAAETGSHELARSGNDVPNEGRIARESQKPAKSPVELEKVAAVQPLAPTKAEDTAAKDTDAAKTAASNLMGKREALAESIRGELNKAFEGANIEAHVSVGANNDGVLITISDDMNHGMFPVGSAVPHHDLVIAMERIARTLSQRAGNIRINGHTDGRPFASKTYDNWRLSTARAHSAYYMLVRGGLAERRVVEVAGFADRKLKMPDDPYSDRNRRIEIVLEVPK